MLFHLSSHSQQPLTVATSNTLFLPGGKLGLTYCITQEAEPGLSPRLPAVEPRLIAGSVLPSCLLKCDAPALRETLGWKQDKRYPKWSDIGGHQEAHPSQLLHEQGHGESTGEVTPT